MSDREIERLARLLAGQQAQIDGLMRTQQVARTVVGGVPVEDRLAQAADSADRVASQGDDIARLDDGTGQAAWDAAQRVPTADDYLDDFSQRQDEASDALGGLDEWRDERYDEAEAGAIDLAGIRADVEQAGRDIVETREELDGKLADLDTDLETAGGRITSAQERADAAFGKAGAAEGVAGGADSKATNALTMAGSKTQVLYSEDAPAGVGELTQVWRRQDPVSKDILQEWRGTGTGWEETKISSQAIANLDVGKLTVGTGIISDLVAQHIAGRTAAFQEVSVENLFVTAEAVMRQAVIDKLYADVVKAKLLTVTEKIIAHDIFADGVVSAAALAATAIDGKIITGATVRTAATGQRWVIDAFGIRGYDASNLESVLLEPSSQGLVVTDASSASKRAQISSEDIRVSEEGRGTVYQRVDDYSNRVTADRFSTAVSGPRSSATLDASEGVASFRANCRDEGTESSTAMLLSSGNITQLSLDHPGSSVFTIVYARGGDVAISGPPVKFVSRTTNPGNSFISKTLLNAWNATDGTHAWVTSEDREYVRAGGLWRVAWEDTDWINLSLTGATGPCQYKIKNGELTLQADITLTTALGVGAAITGFFTLPGAVRPGVNAPMLVNGQGTYAAGGYVTIGGVPAIRNFHSAAVQRFQIYGSWPIN